VKNKWSFLGLVALATLCVAGLVTGTTEPVPQRDIEFVYTFTIKDLPPGAENVHAWVPIPRENGCQRLLKYKVLTGQDYRILEETEYGNRFLYFDLSGHLSSGNEDIMVSVEFHVERQALRVLDNPSPETKIEPDRLEKHLQPHRLVPVDGKIAEEARQVAGDASTPLEQARRLYDHIVSTLRYDKSGEGWGQGDAVYACDVRKGNCTDFHSLFIGEARSLRIPSRFIMGFPLPEDKNKGTIPGYHCWAEFYVEDYGWVPIDASEASKNPQKIGTLFGGLDSHRIEITIGRDIKLPLSDLGAQNYVVYPVVEVDGNLLAGIEKSFSFRDPGS